MPIFSTQGGQNGQIQQWKITRIRLLVENGRDEHDGNLKLVGMAEDPFAVRSCTLAHGFLEVAMQVVGDGLGGEVVCPIVNVCHLFFAN